MKVVHYIPGLRSVALPDAQVETAARAFLAGTRETIEVSNELFLLAVRVLVNEGVFPHDDVVFYLADGTRATLDQWGRTSVVLDEIGTGLLMRILAPRQEPEKPPGEAP